jgi:hypothetical protein
MCWRNALPRRAARCLCSSQARRDPPNCQNELLGELQAISALRAANKVLLKSRLSFFRQSSEQVCFSYFIGIDGTAISAHGYHSGWYLA